MASYFLDTSAFAKYYHPEPGSEVVAAIFAGAEHVVRVSDLGVLEMESVFAMKVRIGETDRAGASRQRMRMIQDIAAGNVVVRAIRAATSGTGRGTDQEAWFSATTEDSGFAATGDGIGSAAAGFG